MSTAAERFRRFSRFFTQFVGALDPHFAGMDLTLAEARLLYEIAHRAAPLAADLQAALKMDAGFVSRVLQRFETRGWIIRQRGSRDGRHRPISMTAEGARVFRTLDERQQTLVEDILGRLSPGERRDLVRAIALAEALLAPKQERGRISLRPFQPGDMGLITARQSILYRENYGWNEGIEINIGKVTSTFLRDFKPGREQCWIAELDEVMAGSVLLTDEGEGLCRLRLLYVEPFARGLGIGEALVRATIDFAQAAGYRDMTLWTHTILESARRLYARHGFVLTESALHETFGQPLMGETWCRRLD
ncbi:bifunctional helix-turn-helix transcriptional regulator/GNAT family N-acetyltransferase [Acidisoma sp. C75]